MKDSLDKFKVLHPDKLADSSAVVAATPVLAQPEHVPEASAPAAAPTHEHGTESPTGIAAQPAGKKTKPETKPDKQTTVESTKSKSKSDKSKGVQKDKEAPAAKQKAKTTAKSDTVTPDFKAKIAEKIKEAQAAGKLGEEHTKQTEPHAKQIQLASSSHAEATTSSSAGDAQEAGVGGAASSGVMIPLNTASESAPASGNDDQLGEDITNMFGAKSSGDSDPKDDAPRNAFLNCEFVLPGIALKKMKQALRLEMDKNRDPRLVVGALGGLTVTAYRAEKLAAHGMILGDLEKYGEEFWKKAMSHLKFKKVVALMITVDVDDESVKDVPRFSNLIDFLFGENTEKTRGKCQAQLECGRTRRLLLHVGKYVGT